MLLGTHVDDFMLAASSTALAYKFASHFGQYFSCKKIIAREFVRMYIIRDRDARKIYLSQALLIDRLLETEFAVIMQREGLTGNDLRYNPGQALHKWEALCSCSAPFDSKMSRISVADCPAMPDPRLVHWMQGFYCTLCIPVLTSCTQSISCLGLFTIAGQLMSRLSIIYFATLLGHWI
jgi:hypothetical protein